MADSTKDPSTTRTQKGPATGSTTEPSALIVDRKLNLTNGWYIFIYCAFMVLTANTKLAVFTVGIGSLALIYQTTLLVQGK